MSNPSFKTGDTAYILWRNQNPIIIRWQGKKHLIFFPKNVLSQKILSEGTFSKKDNTFIYQGLNDCQQPQKIYEDGLFKTRYEAEKEARKLITSQVVKTLKIFFEIASKAGYGSKKAWREIMDAAVIQLYEEIEPKA